MKAMSGLAVLALVALGVVAHDARGQQSSEPRRHVIDYAATRPALEIWTPDSLAVAVQDRRSSVLSGTKPETFVGVVRALYGIPIDVHTKSGQPLATDVGDALVQAFAFYKVKATAIRAAPNDSREQIAGLLKNAGAVKALLLTFDEWRTDSRGTTRVDYRIRAELLDSGGLVLARNEVQGSDALASSPNGAQILEKKVEELFKGSIASSLGKPPADAVPAVTRASGPTLGQIQPVRNRVGGTLHVFIPDKNAILERGIRKTGEPRKEITDYIAESSSISNRGLYDCLVKRNSYDHVILHYSNGEHVDPRPGEFVLYLFLPNPQSGGWLFLSDTVKREPVQFDNSKTERAERIQYWLASVDALARIK